MKKKTFTIGDSKVALRFTRGSRIPTIVTRGRKIDIKVEFIKKIIYTDYPAYNFVFDGINVYWDIEEDKFTFGFSNFDLLEYRDEIKDILSR